MRALASRTEGGVGGSGDAGGGLTGKRESLPEFMDETERTRRCCDRRDWTPLTATSTTPSRDAWRSCVDVAVGDRGTEIV